MSWVSISSQEDVPERFAGVTKARWAAALAAAAVGVGLLTALGGGTYRLHPALPAYLGAQWRAAAGEAFEAERQAALRALLNAYAKFGAWLNGQIEGGSAETAFAMIALPAAIGDTVARMIEALGDEEK
ncbi:MAG: hypothetical protein V3S40_00990 [Kiloniellales bacterium]